MYSEGRQQLVSPEHFRAELQAQMERAATRGQKDIVMSALELHVALGVFPRPNHHNFRFTPSNGHPLVMRSRLSFNRPLPRPILNPRNSKP
jgi:hypothetical protein